MPKLIAFKSYGTQRSSQSWTTIVHFEITYLDQYKRGIVHAQERERLGEPEALDDKGRLQQCMEQEYSRTS